MKATSLVSTLALTLSAGPSTTTLAQTPSLPGFTNALVERLGVFPAEQVRRLSPDGCHVASIVQMDHEDAFAVYLDARRVASWPQMFTNLMFSPDSSRLAYIVKEAGRDGAERLVLDNMPGPKFEVIDTSAGRFSPDSKRFIYVASRGKQLLLIEGARERQVFDNRVPVFSPDSKRLAYVVKRADKVAMVVEDSPEKGASQIGPEWPTIYTDSMVFSPDSQRTAYACRKGGGHCYVIDGRPQQEFDSTGDGGCVFSPDSKHYMYAATNNGKWFVVRDGSPGPEYDAVGRATPVFSPDSKRWAYFVRRNGKRLAVTSEGEGPPYDATASDGPIFSPDSRRLAYAARLGKEWFVIVDNERSQPMQGFNGLRFSPDSRRFMYGAGFEEKSFLVIDGHVGPAYHAFPYTEPLAFGFSPDSRHLAFVADTGSLGMSRTMVVDEQQGPPFDEILPGAPAFRPDGTIEYLALKNALLYRVKQTLAPSKGSASPMHP